MLKKTITFSDLDGNQVSEDFYFNLSKAELAEWELSYKGGLEQHLMKIIEDGDGATIISTFKDIIARSIGKRGEDGRRFIKSPEIVDDFLQSDAYSEFFFTIVTDADKAAEFIRGIVPQEFQEKLDENKKKIIENADFSHLNLAADPKLEIAKNSNPFVKTESSSPSVAELEAQLKAAREREQNN